MKSSLNQILFDQLVGKKISKQESIHERFWGAKIIDVYVGVDSFDNNFAVYILRLDIDGNNILTIDPDYEMEIE